MFDFWQVMRLMGKQTAAEVGWSDKEEVVLEKVTFLGHNPPVENHNLKIWWHWNRYGFWWVKPFLNHECCAESLKYVQHQRWSVSPSLACVGKYHSRYWQITSQRDVLEDWNLIETVLHLRPNHYWTVYWMNHFVWKPVRDLKERIYWGPCCEIDRKNRGKLKTSGTL